MNQTTGTNSSSGSHHGRTNSSPRTARTPSRSPAQASGPNCQPRPTTLTAASVTPTQNDQRRANPRTANATTHPAAAAISTHSAGVGMVPMVRGWRG